MLAQHVGCLGASLGGTADTGLSSTWLLQTGSMRMMPSGDVIAIPLAERLREKARAARAAASTPSKAHQAPDSSAAIAPALAEGAVAFAVAGAVHRHKTAAAPTESGQTPQGRWHSAFSASSGIFSGYVQHS